ncbi:unnamed protein product [Rotaria magnacalcarata]|uniref:Uncharacterized protein n=1 Tax=Rotaria magnacalcarata TaxID=392030 RepID=A0A816R0V3_9BILA|nr:unnamed protein product [Rotaria magnacalcarata]
MDEEGFYLSLNASASYNMYRDNTLATFKNDLHSPIDFDQEQWMVGLAEVQIDSGVINVSHADAKFSVQREMMVEIPSNKRTRKAIDSYLDIKAVTPKKDEFLSRNYVSIEDIKNVFVVNAESSEEYEEESEAILLKDKFSFEIDSKHYNRAEDVIQAINKALNAKKDELKNLWLISDPVLDDTQKDDSKRKLSISISTEAINEKYVFTFSKQLAFLLGSGTDNVLTLNHFPLVYTQSAITESAYTQISPVAQINSHDGPVDFMIPTATAYFLSPSDIKMYLRGTIVNQDNTAVGAGDDVFLENNFLHTLFSKVEIFLNDQTTAVSTCHYAYRSYLENLLNYDTDTKQTVLQKEGFFAQPEIAAQQTRFKALTNKTIEVYGNLHTDFTLQPRLLMSGINVKIRFTRTKPQFYVRAETDDARNENPYFKIQEVYLYIRRVQINPKIFFDVEQQLAKETAKYPLNRVETKILTLETGISNKQLDNIFLGNLPRRIVVGILNHTATDGDYASSPFVFSNHNLTSIHAYVNGMSVGKGYDCLYSAVGTVNSLCMRAYDSIYTVSSGPAALGNGITLQDYANNGYALYAFDLSPDAAPDCDDYINPIQTGVFSLRLSFSVALGAPLNLLIYAESTGLVEIDKTRSITNNI